MNNLISDLCREIGLEEEQFSLYVDNGLERIKKFKIARKDKSKAKREIIVPSWELKIIQYWLIVYYLKGLPSSELATAFHKGSSVFKNASSHSSGNYFVKVDIQSFFPSLTADIFRERLTFDLHENPDNSLLSDLLNAIENKSLIDALFYNNCCVIGYPASPFIANYILNSFDQKIMDSLTSNSKSLGKFSYTRYADDIVVSCEHKGQKNLIYNILSDTLEKSFNGSLKLNSSKTKMTTRSGGSTKITGILICSDGRLTLHRRYKDHVRLLFSLYSRKKLKDDDVPSLIGHLNYIRSVDPVFYNKIYTKYYKDIKSLK